MHFEKVLTQFKTMALIETQGNKEVVFTDGYNAHEFRVAGEKFVNWSDCLWQCLKALRDREAKQFTVDGVKITTKQYASRWVLNIRRLDMDGKFTKDGFCISAEAALDVLDDAIREICSSVTPAVDYVKRQPLFFRVILYTLYLLTEVQVNGLARENCGGCTPSEHHVLNIHTYCIMSPVERMRNFALRAVHKVNVDQVVATVTEYCKEHHIPQNRLIKKFIDRALNSYTLHRLLISRERPSGDTFNDVYAAVIRTQP